MTPEERTVKARVWRKKWVDANKDRINARARARKAEKLRTLRDLKIVAGCDLCGYRGCSAAMDFHHRDPNQKAFMISLGKPTLVKLVEESHKCAILCATCHREVHAGVSHV